MDEAYLQAVRDAIRTAFSVDAEHCEVTPDGKATPIAGEWFYAVHPGTLQNSAQNCLDELVSLNVTVTMRTGFSPADRLGEAVIVPVNGLIDRVKRLRALLHMNYAAMDVANGLLGNVSGYVEPLMFLNAQWLGPKGPDWFWAEGHDDSITGLAVQLTFGRAKRTQYIESQT